MELWRKNDWQGRTIKAEWFDLGIFASENLFISMAPVHNFNAGPSILPKDSF